VQVDPIKPELKPPGTERLTLKCDKLLSSFAFNFNLRRYTTAAVCRDTHIALVGGGKGVVKVGRCRMILSNYR
jgi:hypothetical protein